MRERPRSSCRNASALYADRPAFYLLFRGTTSNELSVPGTGRRLMRKEVDDATTDCAKTSIIPLHNSRTIFLISLWLNGLRDYAGANQHIRSHLIRGTYRATARFAVWAARPCLPQDSRSVASGRTRPLRVTFNPVLARKWRPTFFLLSGAKKVGRHKSSQTMALCLETMAPSTENGAFGPSKNRHFPPFQRGGTSRSLRFKTRARRHDKPISLIFRIVVSKS